METLVDILKMYDIESTYISQVESPAVTKHILSLKSGERLQSVYRIQDEIEMKLGQKIRIVKNWSEKDTFGIELRRDKRSVLEYRYPRQDRMQLFLGYTFKYRTVNIFLDKMPHILIGGATSSGKSILLRSIMWSLISKHHKSCKIVVVDPKIVEFTDFQDTPHMLVKPINNIEDVNEKLDQIVKVIEKRFVVFSRLGCKNIGEYNLTGNFFNYIVIVIDEFADLMLYKDISKDFSAHIQRIAQIGRAAGVHLIMATQRPSAKVITGEIKSNIPCRISLRTTSAINSRIILGQNGAEKLYGAGDALLLKPGHEETIRFQTVLC